MQHRPIRLVAIDLDGTLLNDAKRVTERTVDALRRATGAGVRVVIASARPPRGVRHVYQSLALDTWQVNYNGALLWDEPNRRAVEHRPMAPETVLDLVRLARGRYPDVLVSCEILDRWCTDRFDQTYTNETGRRFRPDDVAPGEQFCVEPVTKLMLLAAPATLDELEPALRRAAMPVSVIRGDPDLIQLMDASADKGAALRRVAEHYGVTPDEVMAIGDAVNDVPMLRAAGVAVAMDNAHPDVKAVADWVAPSNNDHGVHAALERFGLCRTGLT
jgi:Cof subfamily protein (haloacid dehalogenase superfamily)